MQAAWDIKNPQSLRFCCIITSMTIDISEFEKILKGGEKANVEFKSARGQFDEDKDLMDYCAAIANEGGGYLVLGVHNNGQVLGSSAFQNNVNKLSMKIYSSLKIRVDVEEFTYEGKRVVLFHIPSRLVGQLVKSTGNYRYPMRLGESLTEMDQSTMLKILTETEPDFSNTIVEGLTISDLDNMAIKKLKELWAIKSGRPEFSEKTDKDALNDLSLVTQDGVKYAALISVGKAEIISKFLPDAEIIFEWRQDSQKIPHDFRKSWRQPFLNIYDDIWNTINARNVRIPYQDGFIQREIYAFDEKSIREAVLNAVTHRNYSIRGQSIFIKATPEEFAIESPGGFVQGITIANILSRTAWRNRMLAEVFEKTGLVERSGQGVNDIFENSIINGKGVPDLSKSNNEFVRLIIPAQIKDTNFIRFIESISRDTKTSFSFNELYELEKIRENKKVSEVQFKDKFLESGVIEQCEGRPVQYMLSHKYYKYSGRLGEYTRIVGITRDQKKQLIVNHIKKNKKGYFKDIILAFPDLKIKDVNNLLQELRREKKIKHVGSPRSGYWELN